MEAHLSRMRRFVTLVGLMALVAAACTPAAQARDARAPANAGRYGGSLAVRLYSPPGCLDPLKPGGDIVGPVWSEIFDTLVDVDGRGKIQPDLATSWTFSNGGKWVTFVLRQGVRFSNGDAFDARSVKSMVDANLKLGPAFISIGPIKSVQVVDKYRVRFKMSAPFESFLTSITSVPMADVGADRRAGDRSCGFPIGTGAYKTQSVGPANMTIRVIRNPQHTWNSPWLHQGPGYLDQIVFKTVISDTTAVSQFLSGELDIASVPGSQFGRVQGNRNITLHRFLAFLVQFLAFNTAKPPFNRADVRRAIAEAIDRNTLIKVALRGLGRPALSVTGPKDPFTDPRAAQFAPRYNPDDARRILATNHVSGPFQFIVFGLPLFRVTAEIIQAQLAQVGVKVNIVVKPLPEAMGAYARGLHDMALGVSPGTNYENIGLPGPTNPTFYRNPYLIQLINSFRRTINPQKARRLAIQIQRVLNRNVVVDPLFAQSNVLAARSRLKGWHMRYFGLIPVLRDLYLG